MNKKLLLLPLLLGLISNVAASDSSQTGDLQPVVTNVEKKEKKPAQPKVQVPLTQKAKDFGWFVASLPKKAFSAPFNTAAKYTTLEKGDVTRKQKAGWASTLGLGSIATWYGAKFAGYTNTNPHEFARKAWSFFSFLGRSAWSYGRDFKEYAQEEPREAAETVARYGAKVVVPVFAAGIGYGFLRSIYNKSEKVQNAVEYTQEKYEEGKELSYNTLQLPNNISNISRNIDNAFEYDEDSNSTYVKTLMINVPGNDDE